MSKRKLDHVVFKQDEEKLGYFLCRHCDGRWHFEMPVSIDVMVAASKAYGNLHRYCATPPTESGEPTYPCADCGKPRTKAQGGNVFNVCDTCWAARSQKEEGKP